LVLTYKKLDKKQAFKPVFFKSYAFTFLGSLML